MSLKVAIIGAGPSGLAACRAALQEGLVPTMFDKAAGVGGLWRQDDSGQVWRSLRTNLSKYTCAFSDAPWPESAPDFPSGVEVQAYLEQYASGHGLLRHMRPDSLVSSVARADDACSGWLVSWEASGAERRLRSEVFDRVVVATGIFSKPHELALPGIEGFAGDLIHAASYREPTPFLDKRVLVVGGAFSGADIAADLAGSAVKVVVASRRPLWYLPRFIGGRPTDLAFYSRQGSDRQAGSTDDQRNAAKHGFFRSLVGDLPKSLEAPDPGRGDLPFVAISDHFLDAVRSGGVTARATDVVRFEGRAAVFADGHKEEFDAVILATGYRLELPFLSQRDQDFLELDSSDLLQPAILHECVWRPELPGMAFAGIYRGPYFAAMELQARWACGVFSGRLPAPTADELAMGLEAERLVRVQQPRPQFPHGDYVGMSESLARRVGVHPGEIMNGDPHDLGKLLYEGPLLPFHYRLVGFGSERAVAEAAIRECSAKYPSSL